MTDSIIINKLLIREYPDNHQVIYLYCRGNLKISKSVIDKVFEDIKPIFYHAIQDDTILNSILDFLENKKKEYLMGNIKIKSLY